MQINQNPFVTDIFISKWSAVFAKEMPFFSFSFIAGLRFYKHSILPIYINAGRNLTKGISYNITKSESLNLKKFTAIIYDVPDYLDLTTSDIPESVALYRIKQYPGFLSNLKKFKNVEAFLNSTFSKKTINKLRRYENRLHLCFDIEYKMYYGEISKSKYNFLFNEFRKLLEKRFEAKQITNNNLDPKEWSFYYDVAFELIKKKKASLFVVYQKKTPIAITLNYIAENRLFHGITTFDIDYSKFHLGKIALKNLVNWCIDNDIHVFDFSKGFFDYKAHWSNKRYNFEYHIYYDKNSIRSRILALSIKNYFKLKQHLREKHFNKKLHRFTYWLKRNEKQPNVKYKFSEVDSEYQKNELLEINVISEKFESYTKLMNEFLFLHKESLNDLEVYKVINQDSALLFKGKKVSKMLKVY